MITVINDFISDNDFDKIQKVLLGSDITWGYSPNVAHEGDNDTGYFFHMFYNFGEPKSNYLRDGLINPILHKLKMQIPIRMKGNLYPSTQTLKQHAPHVDYEYKHKAAVFCINTCNGGTTIEGETIKSVANRMILFDGSKPHNSSTCTDAPARVNINFNWLDPIEPEDAPNGRT